jgi:hypothetical protein
MGSSLGPEQNMQQQVDLQANDPYRSSINLFAALSAGIAAVCNSYAS